jgi:TRAP-type transport system periplasmic protein
LDEVITSVLWGNKKSYRRNVVFKFYPGGVSGDEKDVIRKMRIGQLHGAGFTGV